VSFVVTLPRQAGSADEYFFASQMALSLQEPKDVVYSLAFSPDGKLLAAGGCGSVGARLEPCRRETRDHSQRPWRLGPGRFCFTPDGKYLATGSADNTAQIWEVETWKSLTRIQLADAVQGVAFGPTGAYGKWLRQHDAVVRINQVVFVHGGISPNTSQLGCKGINEKVRADLTKDIDRRMLSPWK
jgi:hypothetical protein